MRRVFTCLVILCLLVFGNQTLQAQVAQTKTPADTLKNTFSLRERKTFGFGKGNTFSPLPGNLTRVVEFDAENKRYVIRQMIGGREVAMPQYLTIDQYQRLLTAEIKTANWRNFSDSTLNEVRQTGIIPAVRINSKSFERIFGGTTIDIQPRGEAELTFLGRVNRNENPLFNERQRVQTNFDFNQRIQMNLVGNIGTKLKLLTNYNTEAQFDFENQIKLDYTGAPDEIIKKIEAGNVSMPLNGSLISGTQALFGIKTQLQFGKLGITSVFSQQKSQSKEIQITNGAQQNEFRITGDNYEANKHFFLAQFFRNNYNKALANAPNILSPVNITKIEVWITNKSSQTQDSRDVLALLDLGENSPYNTAQIQGGPGYSLVPSGFAGAAGIPQSNNLLTNLPAGARFSNSNDVIAYFQANGATDNFNKLTYARRLNEREYILQPQLGYISLNNPLNADEVLTVAYRYTYNGVEYQVGEFSTDVSFDQANPKVLFTKMLKNETMKINLPTWDLMMKNIYLLGGYQIGSQNFKLNIYRIDDNSGVEKPLVTEGQNTGNKQFINLTGLDRLNQQQEQKPDGVFDFIAMANPLGSTYGPYGNSYSGGGYGGGTGQTGSNPAIDNTVKGYVTIDPLNGRLIFPVIEPFGADLAARFAPGEQSLIQKYTFPALYDSTQVIAKQLFPKQNRYIISGTYQSEVSSDFSLNTFNVPQGSVRVFAGNIPLQEGTDFTVDYMGGRVKILNTALLTSGQPIRITTENNELFGVQQRSLFGTRLDYRVNSKLNLGGTIMNLSEKPITPKVNIGEEPISNTIWGLDLNYNAQSRFLTKLIDKLPFLSTKAPSNITFSGEFAQLVPGHSRALNMAGDRGGTSYLDDFEASRSIIDLKGAISWQISGTPQLFPEAQRINDLSYGYNRARLAFYNIDPIFFTPSSLTPANIRTNAALRSDHYTREVRENEVFPFKQIATGQPLQLPTLDVAFYPSIRGPYNYVTTGFNPDGSLTNPRSRWGGMYRRIETNDFESLNIEYIEFWLMDPFMNKPASQGGDLYFNLGNISEDILKDGRKSLENGLPANGDPTRYDETNWGRVPKLQPVVQAFDNDPDARRAQDVGLDGLNNQTELTKFANPLAQIRAQLNPGAAQSLDNDPSSDDFVYYRGPALDQVNANILQRYEKYNGTEGNSKTPQQAQQDLGVDNAAATALPDGEDVNRDNNMTQSDEYFQYKVSLVPNMSVGDGYVTDKLVTRVQTPDGQNKQVTWYQFRVPLAQYDQKVGNIQDFKSIRFFRMFLTNFADTAVLRFAKLQLVRGDWRQYNAKNEADKVITDPALQSPGPDNSVIEVATINIEENGRRSPIPYVLPPGIEREQDFSNFRGDTRQNEQSLVFNVRDLRDGYGRATFKTAINDFRSYRRLAMFIHAEASGATPLNDNDIWAFLRIGTDNQDNYYEYSLPLKVTRPGTSDPGAIWPDANRMDLELELFQKAKVARNNAVQLNGQPWPINLPYRYVANGQVVIVKGQPDMSKVRIIMLGVKNPLRNPASPAGDDGLDKTAQVWFNELRLTEFDERGGWAATARMNAKLADLGDLNVSGSKSTIGFGSIDRRVSERNRADNLFFDINSNMELGKFFPQKTGISIPMFASYSSQISTPQFNPRTPDIELKNALEGSNRQQRDSILNFSQDFTTRRSLSFTNVHKERTDPNKPARLWDIENLSVSYGFAKYQHRDFINESSIENSFRGSLAYTFTADARNYQPFDKLIKSNLLAILKDLNFTLRPNFINFRIDLDRYYAENTLRNNDPNNFIPIQTTFNKNFQVTRVYGIGWKLTKSLTLDFNATNYSIIDEPEGRINGLKRDTVWQNLLRLGRTTNYNHTLNVTYEVPIAKIPGLDWIELAARYGTNFNWQTEPLSTLRDPRIDLGNTVQNSRTIQLNPTLGFSKLYNKFPALRKAAAPDAKPMARFLAGLATSLKSVNIAYTEVRGTFLPGYLPESRYFGIDDMGAPGLGFVFGSQRDIRSMAMSSGWLTRDTLQSQLYVNTLKENFSLTGQVEPLRDLRIQITATRNQTRNFSSNFRFDPSAASFRDLGAQTTGDYSVSFIALGTAFSEKPGGLVSGLFNRFMANRAVISGRLGAMNPNSAGASGGFADGYGQNAQDVVVGAFLAAYTGADPGSSRLNAFPKIPLPNWSLTYGGLSKIPFLAETFTSFDIKHGYSSLYSVGSFNTLLRYSESNGFPNARDEARNFLPRYQFSQVAISERFVPLVGIDTRLRNNLTASFEINRERLLGLSLANSQLAQFSEHNIVLGLGYRTNKFRFPFGLFKQLKMDNNINFRIDVAVRDNKTVIYRADVAEAEVSAGAKNITMRPNIDYVINQRFNVRLFYDSNVTRPYTSQAFNTSFSNFGFSLRATLN
ncbi:cell surface protein SprA [Pedobacter yulinensis]|uniref:Cell surface protein SprA n=1 Tax=Pedobacter yulinensis TaxID=2126353 RepID=A0A2T3HQI5_9SPHI|nr:cell surface protein SprA [Pedobacter yulinensis]PST84647.1 cell surface protein SprA [Pedobacter yulinensis]